MKDLRNVDKGYCFLSDLSNVPDILKTSPRICHKSNFSILDNSPTLCEERPDG